MDCSGEMVLILVAAAALIMALARRASAGVIVGASSKVPPDPRQVHARWVRFRPGDGQIVDLNPPRFSWPYLPEIVFSQPKVPADQRFTLQISKTRDFGRPDVEVRDTNCNFYNFLAPLEGARTWYWRVGYNAGTSRETWSDVRSFTLADGAVAWDRSGVPGLLDGLQGHPRILFNGANRDAVLRTRESDAFSEDLARHMIRTADRGLESEAFIRFLEQDDDPKLNYMGLAMPLMFMAFAYLLTGEQKYLALKERILTIAGWAPGGYGSPEGGGAVGKWSSHLTEFLALIYDWLYDELTPLERDTIRGSLEWRIDHMVNNYAWRTDGGTTVAQRSVAANCASHPYENLMVAAASALAICDESAVAREGLEIGLHHLMGITSAMGEDECWNEGPGYGSSKLKWPIQTAWYLQTAIPELDLGKNPAFSAYCDFFARLSPIGTPHTSFGNYGINEQYWVGSRVTNFRRIAMLQGNPTAMQNWIDSRRRLKELSETGAMPSWPWIDYVLPHYAQEPEPEVEKDTAKLFPVEGWVTASSAPPSDYDAQKDAVSISFSCRARGGYSHAFRSENGFDLHAYGETVAVGGCNTSNQSFFANHTMSHNTILVNGQEQLGAKEGHVPVCGRIIAYEQGKDYVYWAGDATPSYGPDSGLDRFIRHVVFVDGAYVVMYDDLAMREGSEPATFQWLYHIMPLVPLDFDEEAFRLRYAIGDTEVALQHVVHVGDLTFQDYPTEKGMVNPITGEDVTRSDKWLKGDPRGIPIPDPAEAHHLWISHETPRKEMQFLAVIVPFRKGEGEPSITAVDDATVRVAFRDTERRIAFKKDDEADISVDVAAIGKGFGTESCA